MSTISLRLPDPLLDMPDPGLDKLWAEEAELRLKAFKSGKLKSIALEDVMSKYK